MSVKEQKPIVIFRGDNTAAFDLRTIKILLTGDLDLTNATARFDLLGFTKSWTTEEVATGELSIVFDSAQTKAFALGPQTGTLRLFDMSTGMPRQLTVVNKIPFFVTNNVCEIDSQSYGINVQVSGGDVINIEFKVGAGAVEGKADKVKDATAGDLASLTEDGNLEDSGIPKTDVLRKSQMDSTPTAGSQNPVTSDGIKQAIDAATPEDYAQVKAQVETNTQGIAAINGKIPSQASTQNQLADKDFVNSSIATNTATFRGSYNLVSDLGLTVSATEQQVSAAIATKLASLVPPVVPENNDYCFVLVPKSDAEPSVVVRVDRYKCTVTESGGVTTRVWGYEWSLNNSSFTADQWAAISSGITSALVAKLGALPTADELAAALLAKYEKPSAGIPKTDLAAGVQASLDKADTALQTAPVTSVNSQTGEVLLSADNVDAIPKTAGNHLTDAGCITDYLLSPSLEGGIRIRYSSTNINNQTAYVYRGMAVRRGGVTTDYLFDNSQSGIARLIDIYTAIQQIAPAWMSGTYTRTALVSYNGIVYARKTEGIIASRTDPASDTTNWQSKKVSELFLPLTGGTMTGVLSLIGRIFIYDSNQGESFANFNHNSILLNNNGDRYVLYYPHITGTLALLQNLAPDFSTSATYAVNDLCVYNGILYRCTTAITTAEAWTAEHWTEATVEDVLAAIRTALDAKANRAPNPTAGNLASLDAQGNPTNSQIPAANVALKTDLRYALGTATTISSASEDTSGTETVYYGSATLADRTANQVAITATLDELRVTLPAAVSGKVRDFELRVEVGTGYAALTAPAIVVVPPTGETITLENAEGAWPTLADGAADAKGVTVLYFSETAAGKFLVKGEEVTAVA